MKNKTTKERSEISLQVDQYEDIFSDFDIRPFSRRSLSVDFLEEVKRASYDKENDGIEMNLYIPAGIRDEHTEATIKERLQEHFKKHYDLESKEKRRVIHRGLTMVALGVISMLAASYIHAQRSSQNLFQSFLVVFLEPAAWFLLWEGMDILIFTSKNIDPHLQFYRKMSHARNDIHFRPYRIGKVTKRSSAKYAK